MSSVSRSVGRPVSRSVLAGQLNNLASIIKSAFSKGEQGFAYDPNDLSTMWQDEAKLLPVTGGGQPVWHILDKSGNNNHAFATSSATRPILQRNATTGAYYLEFDGVDDFLQTNNIDFTATDKVSLFAGVRKLDEREQMYYEFGDGTTAVNRFMLQRGGNADLQGFYSKIQSTSLQTMSVPQVYAPTNAPLIVIQKFDQKTAPCIYFRVNKADFYNKVAQNGDSFSSQPLYIGRRGGTSLPFKGHLYGLIGIGRLTTDSETMALEKALAKNTGVTLNV